MAPYLPEMLWEQVFFRLPYSSAVIAGCVCKSWKAIESSLYFKRNYRENFKIKELSAEVPVYELTDSNNKVVRWSRDDEVLLDTRSHKNGMVCAFSRKKEEYFVYYVGFPFLDKWEAFPMLENSCYKRVDIFPGAGGGYDLVAWEDNGSILRCSRGDRSWSRVRQGDGAVTDPLTIDERTFAVDTKHGKLLTYTKDGAFTSMPLGFQIKPSEQTLLEERNNSLYVMLVRQVPRGHQMLRVWKLEQNRFVFVRENTLYTLPGFAAYTYTPYNTVAYSDVGQSQPTAFDVISSPFKRIFRFLKSKRNNVKIHRLL